MPTWRRSSGSGSSCLVVLQHEEQQAVAAERAVDRFDRHRPVDGERLQRQRKRDGPPQREDGEFRRKLWSGLGHRGLKALGVRALGSRQAHKSSAKGRSARPGAVVSSLSVWYASRVDERQFFTEKPEQRPARFQCPRCRRTNDYSIRWLRRTKKAQIPSGADERDRVHIRQDRRIT